MISRVARCSALESALIISVDKEPSRVHAQRTILVQFWRALTHRSRSSSFWSDAVPLKKSLIAVVAIGISERIKFNWSGLTERANVCGEMRVFR